MLTTPGRQVGLLADLGEEQRGQRGGLGRLEHDRVAGGQRRGDLPRQHQQREVPRDDLAGDAERPRVRARARRTRACRPSPRSRRSAPRPAGRRRRGDSLIGLPLSSVSSTASSRARSCRIRAMRNRYLPRSAPGIRDPDARCRRGGRPSTARSTSAAPASATSASTSSVAGLIVLNADPPLGLDELAVDEQAVGRLDVDDGAGLGRRCVLELGHGLRYSILSPSSRSRGRSSRRSSASGAASAGR